MKKQRERCQTEQGQRDKAGKSLKFTRDLESDWTVKNDSPNFGLKEHTAVDSRQGFVLATTLTPASVHDTNYISYCIAFRRHAKKKIKKFYVYKGYAGKLNREFLVLSKPRTG
jgi:hypothetical protein